GVDGPPVMPEDPYAYVVAAFQAPPSPKYMPGIEYPPSPDFVQEPVYPEFMPPEDEILPAEEHPLPTAVSPTANSPGYVPESGPKEDPEEDDDEDPEEDPVDGGDDEDDQDESSDDDEDDDVNIEEEEEEHLAPADSTVVALPAVDHAPYAEETEPFETDESAATPPPHPAYWVTARILIRDEPPIPFCLIRRADRPEVTLPPQKRLGITLGLRYEVGESSFAPTARPLGGFKAEYGFVATIDNEIIWDLERDVGYGITNTWDEMLVDMPRAPMTDDTKLGQRMIEFTTRVRQDTGEIYTRLDDEQTERQLMAGRLNMLYRDRCAHARTARLMEAEAMITLGSDYRVTSSGPQETGDDYRDAGSGP
ncbi:hypothetical protein Tco_1398748, partial [Tanacetum coccineum]